MTKPKMKMSEIEKGRLKYDIRKNSLCRIAGVGDALWRPHILSDTPNKVFRQIMDGLHSPFWKTKDGATIMIEVHMADANLWEKQDLQGDKLPMVIIEREDKMPMVVWLKQVMPEDDRFYVYVDITPPSVADSYATNMSFTEDGVPLTVGHRDNVRPTYHYLLHEIAYRVAMAMCYESVQYDNETIKTLMMVDDKIRYETDLDIDLLETTSKPLRFIGLTSDDPFDDTGDEEHYDGSITAAQTALDERFFPSHIEPKPIPEGGFTDEGEVFTPIVPYKDIRPIQEFGKGDFWVDVIRCPRCNQRVKVSLTKAQCPDDIPSVTIACKSCKLSIDYL